MLAVKLCANKSVTLARLTRIISTLFRPFRPHGIVNFVHSGWRLISQGMGEIQSVTEKDSLMEKRL